MRTNSPRLLNRVGLLAGTAGLALTLALGGYALAQTHGSGGSGHESGTSHESGGGHDSTTSHEGGSSAKGKRKGASGERGGGKGGSLRDVFKQMEVEEALDEVRGQRRGQSGETQKGQRGAKAATDKGQRGGQKPASHGSTEAEADDGSSSKPTWAGNAPSSGKRDYGDLYFVVRNADGVPVDLDGNLLPEGTPPLVMFEYEGQLVCCVDRDSEGNLLTTGSIVWTATDGKLSDGDALFETAVTSVLPIEAEFSRTSVIRSPDRVLDSQYAEFIKLLNADTVTSVIVDATGRLVLINSDGTETSIDSPLIYLALYDRVLTTGTLPAAEDRKGDTLVPELDKLPDELKNILSTATYTIDDLRLSATFLAAAMDKSGTATVDMIVYLNSILGVATKDNSVDGEAEYVAYTSPDEFNYDRSDTFSGQEIENIILPGTISEGSAVAADVTLGDLQGTTVTVTRDGDSEPTLSYDITAAPASVDQLVADLNAAFDGAGIINFEISDDGHLVIKASTETDIEVSGLSDFGLDGTITYVDGTYVIGTVSDIYTGSHRIPEI